MNERIQELMEQATVQVDPDDREWVFFKVDQAKFAELLVRECGNVAWKCGSEFFSGVFKTISVSTQPILI